MIGYLKGILQAVQEEGIILNVQGVGYRLFLTQQTLAALPPAGATIEFEVITIVREDALDLYGFNNNFELKLCNLLMKVSGIGPRQAVNILSNSRHEELVRAITDLDTTYLESIRGIGRKTAEKIILELKDHVAKILKHEPTSLRQGNETPFRQDLVTALTQLGYRRNQIDDAIFRLPKERQHTLQQAIRECLRILSGIKAAPEATSLETKSGAPTS
jgi:Holliday junction DNA helicase RuvA